MDELTITVDEMHEHVVASIVSNIVHEDFNLRMPRYLVYFVGPSGIGKTSNLKSIADALEDQVGLISVSLDLREEDLAGIPIAISSERSTRTVSEMIEEIRSIQRKDKIALLFVDEFDKLKLDVKVLLMRLADGSGVFKTLAGKRLAVVFAANPEDMEFNLEREPMGAAERRLVLPLRPPSSVDALLFMEKLEAKEKQIAKLDLYELAEKVKSKVNPKTPFHPFVFAFAKVYDYQVQERQSKMQGNYIMGIYKYPTPRALNFIGLHLLSLEALKGSLSKRDVMVTFQGFMGTEMAELAGKLYDNMTKTGVYEFLDMFHSMTDEEVVKDLTFGQLNRSLSHDQTADSLFFVFGSLHYLSKGSHVPLERKLSASIALAQYIFKTAQKDNYIVREIVASAVASSMESLLNTLSLALSKEATTKEEASEMLGEYLNKMMKAVLSYIMGNGEDLHRLADELKRKGINIQDIDFTAPVMGVLISVAENGQRFNVVLDKELKETILKGAYVFDQFLSNVEMKSEWADAFSVIGEREQRKGSVKRKKL